MKFPRYHKQWATATDMDHFKVKKLVEHVDVQKGFNVLDIACGTGVVTKRLSQKVGKSGHVIAADTSVTAIKIAKKYNKENSNISFVNSDAENFFLIKNLMLLLVNTLCFSFQMQSRLSKI